MTAEHLKVEIGSALDLVQTITEDVESNFLGYKGDNSVSERAVITVANLTLLSVYLESICEAAEKAEARA